MKNKNTIVLFLIAIVAFISCSTKKDAFVNRAYNSITTKYNILYNGNLAFQEGLDQINQQHKDNFWEQLSIEPITFEEKSTSIASFGGNPGFPDANDEEEKPLTTFDKAEEKAVKAIQLHSMNIGGRERNNQIDDAYLLLGKSRYYTQRFIPAIEAFNYVIINYPYADLIDETRIWRAKTNIRLDNDQFAIETLKIVLKNEELDPRIKEEAHTALAMAYVKNDSIQRAIEHLTLATATQTNTEQAARNLFVLGQIYSSENKKDSAAIVFNRLINFKKAPYKFKIYANIDLAKASTSDSAVSSLITKFKTLIKDRENRGYLDALYYQKGLLEEKRDSLHIALKDFKTSLRIPDGDLVQKTYTYEKLGNISFDYSLFVQASAYYDSVIQISKNSTDLRIRQIRRKHKNLAALTAFEATLKTNDSVLKIANLSKLEQITFFKKHIESLKKADEKAAKAQLKNISFGSSFSGGSSIKSTKKGKWYFYNVQSLNFGKNEFEKVWGNRPLEDNWRISDKQQAQVVTTTTSTKKEATVWLPKYNLKTYLDALPQTKSAIDSLIYNRNEALYQTGIIYKEQFKDVDLAIFRLERLLKEKPDKMLLLPTKYHLYQLYSELKSSKAAEYKALIIKEYPASRYAEILQNKPKKQDEKKIGQTEAIYKELYYIYKDDKFEDVVSQIIELAPEIKDSNLIAKFELLKAMAIGKYQSKEAYKKALEYVLFNYGNTKEGQRAKEIIKQLN
ncbi:type IX secretion system periplasmic lipoprotein PorW/SprE [Polaribacter gochangensis]|uniref:type IX secretion system periplasmic lipoprotein PorW/SprE n=1 Tax=Polaribacter gochangensis TaxID=3252903 RepID=UPI003904DE77